jgi:hypothetical protein
MAQFSHSTLRPPMAQAGSRLASGTGQSFDVHLKHRVPAVSGRLPGQPAGEFMQLAVLSGF